MIVSFVLPGRVATESGATAPAPASGTAPGTPPEPQDVVPVFPFFGPEAQLLVSQDPG